MQNGLKHLLIIENSEGTLSEVTQHLKKQGFSAQRTLDESTAIMQLFENPQEFSTVLLDNALGEKRLLSILAKILINSQLKILPIIICIDNDLSIETINTFIRSGANYCLPIPIYQTFASVIIKAAMEDHERYLKLQKAIVDDPAANTLYNAQFKFRTIAEAQVVANFLASACPNPRLAIVGITEIFMNAIEHGNLGITYEEKTKLQQDNHWIPEIDRRLNLPENIQKYVEVIFTRLDQELQIKIIDQGPGFDWKKFEELNNERALSTHGRGIPIAKSVVFSRLEFLGSGNQVVGTIPL